MFLKLAALVAILAVLYLQQATCLPKPQGVYYPPIPTQPIFPPLPPPFTASPSWQSKLSCSGQYNGLNYNDCQNAFRGLIDQAYPGGQIISSPYSLKTSRFGTCKATVSCSGNSVYVDAGVLYYDTNLRGGAYALLNSCVAGQQSGRAVIENACSVSFEPSSSTNWWGQRPQAGPPQSWQPQRPQAGPPQGWQPQRPQAGPSQGPLAPRPQSS